MKFGIDIGHNVSGDTGASGIRREDELNKEVGTRVIDKLRILGHTVILCTPSSATSVANSLYQRVKKANDNKVDVFASIHFNAGGGRGSEVFATSEAGKAIAKKVLNEIVALGFVNRGVKEGNWLYVIRNTVAPAILIECAFVDSKEDMSRYNADAMASAIVTGLTGQKIINDGAKNNSQDKSDNQKKGSSDILKLQQVLNRLKISDHEGKVLQEDGIYGIRTTEAVKRFQRIMAITVDGIAGTQTWNRLNTILGKPLLKQGNANAVATRYVQWRLSVGVDGIFGPITKNVVMNFQKNRGILVDGIVGPNTWKQLIG
ncbi:Autolytic lysozyme [Clostridium sp. N3C]|uniref:N-acetylmuramoyl-L-alanine amidase n=1 Tax=Clostridium sp. N3C TaxID=1776758 RepID=UPI00092E0305|nr:N-acetylmuramoyl-L-alanine amidase [Clostridium sp. N3C]SCN21686.1 Autolytic lysozyme [Clostridium sp. N3C]